MKIYTKTGDKGTTRLVDGSCVEKFNPRVEAYGCVDELNSILGLIRSLLKEKNNPLLTPLEPRLERIQNHLFNVGSLLATEKKDVFEKLPAVTPNHIHTLEQWIDEATIELPDLKNFILPSGSTLASQLHLSRTSCRRAERRAAEISVKEDHYEFVLIYLNRLSDLLFTWARWVNFKMDIPETLWKKDE
ncbi:MAG: ATP:cob(I)alamin adenosyltransferase [Bdellovibrionales bacterium RIFCSPHIGHO2_01_FULL_40_29]|nr:MAG: ATP:cob(I)alamin adenosyltransferase [Bdellovibrionales bacterium RIFCSPHIGHO2_01_FULL_40_29]OFZ34531.1 MAG: ATP:cob(I)alamin adenosyltransferase [Bdellovibrionales bacterium RIFCSPHIGHO2_02_FULL_40_15]